MLARVKQAKFFVLVVAVIALAGAAVAATYVMGRDTPPTPTYAIYAPSVPPAGVVHEHHIGLRARHIMDRMGVNNPEIGFEIHIYRPGGQLVKHTHEDGVHVLYILQGMADYTIGNTTYRVRPGTFVYCAEGIPHSMKVVGKKDLVLVWFSGPAPKRAPGK
jgi:quercetin dioxygenase-like cupin family protein